MANYWAIEIGIHQYRFLPALSYAQRDAELLHQFLIQAGGFAPRRCALLTDAITVDPTHPLFPTAENIHAQVVQCCQRVKPNDLLICSFSGHGLKFQDKDYLLPIEANPRSVATTAIAVEVLLQTLQTAATKNIVLILDANRSQLGWEHGSFGEQTARLAQERGIAVLLSCRPQQFSHEPLTLRQGIFTTALIAALQEGVTLEQVVTVLGNRLPQLSEECWRPRQDLVAVVPPHLRYQILLPNPSQRQNGSPPDLSAEQSTGEMWNISSAIGASLLAQPVAFLSRTRSRLQQAIVGQLQPFQQRAHSPSAGSKAAGSKWVGLPSRPHETGLMLVTEAGADTAPMSIPVQEADALILNDDFFWRRLLVQSGLIGVILLFGVILRNSGALVNSDTASLSQNSSVTKQVANSPQAAVPSPVPASASPVAPEIPGVTVDPALLMQSAQAAFDGQQYEEANRLLAQIPAVQRSPEASQLLEQTNRELLNKAKTMLIRPRQMMSENQVSDLVEAIKVARLIKSDQPLHAEAQQGIERWSRVVMDMAQGRAERPNSASVLDAVNNYRLAISAAQLVPSDQLQVKEQSQQAIDLWSQMILDLANEQAAKGNLDLAIQIGEQVPPNTPIHAKALDSIANWRNQPLPEPAVKEADPVDSDEFESEFESEFEAES